MVWHYALSLAWHAPGFDCTLLHEVRERCVAYEAGPRFPDPCLTTCPAHGWIKARGTHRTDAPHVLAAIRTWHRWEGVLEALHDALNQLRAANPTWVPPHVPLAWDTHYGLRADQMRVPKEASTRAALARPVGLDGSQLLDAGWAAPRAPSLRTLPALAALRPIWVQQYYRGTASELAVGRWRPPEEQPLAAVRLPAPSAREARYGTQRDTQWVGSQLHRSEPGEPEPPDRMPQGLTPPATTPACTMGPPIIQAWAARDLRPGAHLRASGDVDAAFRVTAQQHQSDVVGPPCGADSWQHQRAHGYDWQAFVLDWEAHQAPCPHGHTSVQWPPGHEVAGDPGVRLRFDKAPGRAGPTRHVCPTAKDAPRPRTVRPHAHPAAMPAARPRQEPPESQAQ